MLFINGVVLTDVIQFLLSDDDMYRRFDIRNFQHVADDTVEFFKLVLVKSGEETSGGEDQDEAGRQPIPELI